MIAVFSRIGRASPSRSIAIALAGLAAGLLAACGITPGPSEPPVSAPRPPVVGEPPAPVTVPVELVERAYTPAYLGDVEPLARIGVLLPFSSRNSAGRGEAAQLMRAAELALFERADGNVLLMPKDTGGTREGAASAARAAIEDGADILIGPLFSDAVAGAGEAAREAGVPVLAFSTDEAVAGDGVYLLSFPPGEEVRRIVDYAFEQGATRYAFIGPATGYGQVAAQAYREAVETRTAPLDTAPVFIEETNEDGEVVRSYTVDHEPGMVSEVFYTGGVQGMTEAAGRLASVGVETLSASEASNRTGADWTPSPSSPFQAVLLPEGGDRLRILAPVLLYQDIDPLVVKFLGTGLWRDEDAAREPALQFGWFAGPDPEARSRFEGAYESIYGDPPSRIAGLAYDAASLAALMAANGMDFSRDFIESPDGFVGVDGLFRFREDGTIRRGLAVYTIRGGEFEVLDPAPARFDLMETGDQTGFGTGFDAEPADVEPDEPS
ncbi:penicillin-binding protein activator [Marinicauda salina]|uniref:Penicillin-binding protein activator n=1 Tax=Marinicauda salina TaxID=2135793 RepID=A0A2U2BWM2_9PROT|nr:penicillin-binding protein activator [Marinicauda salina]PWE18397.1 penicillin-binding protein activator [Marinicauda salina]